MGILDRLRSSNKQPPMKPRGGSGRGNYSGFLAQVEEENFELRFPNSLRVYDRMFRTDPDVRKNLRMTINPVLNGTWGMEPFGGDEAEDKDREVAEETEWALFTNMAGGGLLGHLAQALPVLARSGFAPFEVPWEHTKHNGRDLIVPRALKLRLPRSIVQFHEDDEEELERLTQQLPIGGQVDLFMEDLIYYRLGAEGDNWEGNSLLRSAYKPWFYKDGLERIDVIKAERQAMGIPICYPPDGADAEQLEEMERILGAIRAAEDGFIIVPGPHAQDLKELAAAKGWRIEILGIGDGESTMDLNPSIERNKDAIAAACISDFMRLGQGQGASGARATADSQEDPFLAAVEAFAGEIETVLDQLVNRFVALNFDVEEPPKLRMSLVDSTSLTELSEYAGKLVQAGVLHPDNELEDFFRQRGDLPPADAEARDMREQQAEEARELQKKAATAPTPPPPPPPKPGDPRPPAPPEPPKPAPAPKPEPKKDQPDACSGAMDATERREMRWWEELMSLDEIEGAIDNARGRFETVGGPAARNLASEMAEAALAGKIITPKPDEDLQKALYGELARLYRTGRSTVIDELEAQRPGVGDAAATDAEGAARKRLLARAKLAAQSISNRIWQQVSHTVMNRPGDRAAAQTAGEAEAAAGLRAEAQLHAAGALNEGRQDEADAHDEIAGARYTSILDRRRCDQCSLADDDVLRKLNDPVRLAHKPPNQDCYGGGRCRCMEFYELRDEEPGYGGGTAPPEPSLTPPPGPGGALAEDHFTISGASPDQTNLIKDQLRAIDEVHSYPKSIPIVPIKVRPKIQHGGSEAFGTWGGAIDERGVWHDEQIKLSGQALRRKPPITSAVHEIGHSLDGHGFGDGTPVEVMLSSGGRDLYSSTPAMAEWRQAVFASPAYGRLVVNGNGYKETVTELLARSYEQYIATRSGNKALRAKIEQRLSEEPDMYWSDSEFEPIAEAFDRFFATRGLR